MRKFKEIRSDYYNEEENATYIDAWKTTNIEEEGIVVAKVFNDGKVKYAKESYKNNKLINEEIQEVLKSISKEIS